jgi:uncharacterized protein YdiU (UPF0061 family)
LPDTFYAKQDATPSPNPSLIKANAELASQLNIDPAFLTADTGLAMFAGNAMPNGADPLARAYAGHPFGGWSPQLGDGRALLLGEIIGADKIRYDIQLTGSGRTPYSRGGDGKAAIGPVIREYVVSEAMAALGVPTTRALAAVTTGEDVIREGRLPGAILTRIAQSHVRVGTCQYFYARNDAASLQTLADYMIDRHYPEARQAENPIRAFYAAVVARQAKLIALWLKFGFIHGVMNTDNCQIAGETIDYGPCAFMDDFNPNKVFSSIDQQSRYAWGKQPTMAHWNLTRLGEALIPIWGKDDDTVITELQNVLDGFSTVFTTHFHEAFAQKLGLQKDATGNAKFFETTFQTMTANAVDFTLFFSHLRRLPQAGHRIKFIELFSDATAADTWLDLWQAAKDESGITASESQTRMDAANPIYIPRNHRVEEAIAAATKGDYEPFHKLHDILHNPFDQQPGASAYEEAPQPEEIVHQTFCGT